MPDSNPVVRQSILRCADPVAGGTLANAMTTTRTKLVLAESRPLRFFSFFVLYLAQGFPFGMVNTAIPGFLAERGASPADLGYFALASLPWSLKLLPAPLMDRFTYLAMGRR